MQRGMIRDFIYYPSNKLRSMNGRIMTQCGYWWIPIMTVMKRS